MEANFFKTAAGSVEHNATQLQDMAALHDSHFFLTCNPQLCTACSLALFRIKALGNVRNDKQKLTYKSQEGVRRERGHLWTTALNVTPGNTPRKMVQVSFK